MVLLLLLFFSCPLCASAPDDVISVRESKNLVSQLVFNPYSIAKVIAISEGETYEQYTVPETHPGPVKTRKLMKKLIESVLELQKDEIEFVKTLHEKVNALKADSGIEEYRKIHPWFAKDFSQSQLNEVSRRVRWLQTTSTDNLQNTVNLLNFLLQLVTNEANWDEIFRKITQVIIAYLELRNTNIVNLYLPCTTPKSKANLRETGDFWHAALAERSTSIMSLQIALLRFTSRFVSWEFVKNSKAMLSSLCLTKIAFNTDELEEDQIDPDSLGDQILKSDEQIQNTIRSVSEAFLNKNRNITAKQKFATLEIETDASLTLYAQRELKIIKEKIVKKLIAMPKPFGTKAREQAAIMAKEEKDRLEIAAKRLENQAKKQYAKERKASGRNPKSQAEPGNSLEKAPTGDNEIEFYLDTSTSAAAAVAAPPSPAALPLAELAEDTTQTAAASEDEAELSESDLVERMEALRLDGDEAAVANTEQLIAPPFKLNKNQRKIWNAIFELPKRLFSFEIEDFELLMKALGFENVNQQGSHVTFKAPNGLREGFATPHGWTNRFGPGAMGRMKDFITNGLGPIADKL